VARAWNDKTGGGARRQAAKIEELGWIDGDIPGTRWKVERRYWKDGTSCLHVIMWGWRKRRPADTKLMFTTWFPLKMLQLPWELAGGFLLELVATMYSPEM
jgi:hypothetical protein